VESQHHPTHNFSFPKPKLMMKEEKKDYEKKRLNKFNRMFTHFSIILSSFGVYLHSKDEEQSGLPKTAHKKFLYFVGKGNNKNLILSVLKKRWWWAETETIVKANLIWSQLKNEAVLERSSSLLPSELDSAQPQRYASQTKPTHGPIYSIFHSTHSRKFHEALPEPEQHRLLRGMSVPEVLHNHYPSNFMLGNKKALFYNMTEYKQFKGEDPFAYIPLTFHI
jgi:hypothetical protein